MLKDFNFKKIDDRYDNFKRSELGEQLDTLQRVVQRLKIPVLIFVDGLESSGRGDVINDLTRELDPRYINVEIFDERYEHEYLHPSSWRFWQKIPNNEQIMVFDQSFYSQVMSQEERSPEALTLRKKQLLSFETSLLENEMIILKFFLHIKEETQRENIEKLEESEYRQYLLTDRDYRQNENYDECIEWMDQVLEATNVPESPWHIVSAEDRKLAAKTVLGLTIEGINAGIERVTLDRERANDSGRTYQLTETQLDKFDVTKQLTVEEYHSDYRTELQERAAELVYQCYTKGIAIVLAFEGVDAAGKGGAIKRLTRYIDPRSYKIYGIKAPTPLELSYHYLWRFQTKFPEDGDMVIFDRSWYGRVLVERIEGFATPKEWEQAYDEINQMEENLVDHGNLVMKFFLYIDEAEQQERFESRVEEPDKNYKITAEDWRNREQWDAYIDAYEEMLDRTDTDKAPWYIIPTNDKYYARVMVLEKFVKHVEEHLNNLEEE